MAAAMAPGQEQPGMRTTAPGASKSKGQKQNCEPRAARHGRRHGARPRAAGHAHDGARALQIKTGEAKLRQVAVLLFPFDLEALGATVRMPGCSWPSAMSAAMAGRPGVAVLLFQF